MMLSNQDNATLESLNAHLLGYPASINGSSCDFVSIMYHNTGAVVDVTTHVSGRGIVYTELDATHRSSGSPMYYCPTGIQSQCEDGDQGYVFGVLHGPEVDANSNVLSMMGAKVPGNMRDWAIAILPNQ